MHQQARAGAAHLALIEEHAVDQAFDCPVQIGVSKDDEGRLAAQLQAQLLATAGGAAPDGAPYFGRSGEGDLGDARMRHDGLAHRAVAGDDVDHARRQSHLDAQLTEQQGRERSLLGGLEDNRIAAGQRRGDLPGQHQQRKVPRHDLADHAQWYMLRPLGGQQLRPAGVVIEVAHRQRHINVAALADGLAVVQRFEHGKQTRMLLQAAGQGIQELGTLVPAQRSPCWPGGLGRLHGSINFLDRGLRNLGQGLAVGRVDAGKVVPARHPFAVDEMPKPAPALAQPGLCIGSRFGRRAIVHGVQNVCYRRHGISVVQRCRSVQGMAWRQLAL